MLIKNDSHGSRRISNLQSPYSRDQSHPKYSFLCSAEFSQRINCLNSSLTATSILSPSFQDQQIFIDWTNLLWRCSAGDYDCGFNSRFAEKGSQKLSPKRWESKIDWWGPFVFHNAPNLKAFSQEHLFQMGHISRKLIILLEFERVSVSKTTIGSHLTRERVISVRLSVKNLEFYSWELNTPKLL